MSVLGGDVEFESDERALLRLASRAFAGLPTPRVRKVPPLRVRLRLVDAPRVSRLNGSPPPELLTSGAGLLIGAIDAANFALVAPRARSALVCASREMLRRFPRLLRYELIEFAVLTLAARVHDLVPLHAACVGAGGAGALVLGPSGAGKSTLGVHALDLGLEYVAEDSVFVDGALRAFSAPAFLHLRCDSLRGLPRRIGAEARRAPVIRRRSGVRKFEIDLRRGRWPVVGGPMPLAAVVVLSRRSAGHGPVLRPLSTARMRKRLTAEQPYAARQSGWRAFTRGLSRLPAFELRRGTAPAESASALGALLKDLAQARGKGAR